MPRTDRRAERETRPARPGFLPRAAAGLIPAALACGGAPAADPAPRGGAAGPPPASLSTADLEDLSISAAGTCGLFRGGRVRCWGVWDGALVTMPAPAAALRDIAEVAVGHDPLAEQQDYWDHICARTRRGAVLCWGNNQQGQLGAGSARDAPAPVEVAGLGRTEHLALGAQHTCSLTADRAVLCWGGNAWGQTGAPGGGIVDRPAPVSGLAPVLQIAATGDGTCALTEDHRVHCWGAARAELVARDGSAWQPREVDAARGAASIATGRAAACAITADRHIVCWRGVRDLLEPTAAAAGAGVIEEIADAEGLALGDAHGCALRAGGAIWCFGTGALGQLGTGQRTDTRQPPARVPLPNRATRVVAGSANTCARLEDGRWFCWGGNLKGQIARRGGGPQPRPAELDLTRVNLASR